MSVFFSVVSQTIWYCLKWKNDFAVILALKTFFKLYWTQRILKWFHVWNSFFKVLFDNILFCLLSSNSVADEPIDKNEILLRFFKTLPDITGSDVYIRQKILFALRLSIDSSSSSNKLGCLALWFSAYTKYEVFVNILIGQNVRHGYDYSKLLLQFFWRTVILIEKFKFCGMVCAFIDSSVLTFLGKPVTSFYISKFLYHFNE